MPGRSAALLTALTVLTGCGGVSLPRLDFGLGLGSPSSEPLVSTRTCGVHVDGKTAAAHLRIELVPTSRLPRGALIEVEFENPAEGGKPQVASRVFKGNEASVAILSPPLQGVRPRNYEVVARIYASTEKKQVLGIHTQACQSLIDQRDVAPGRELR